LLAQWCQIAWILQLLTHSSSQVLGQSTYYPFFLPFRL
jgi:hypothetical protein